MPVSEPTHSADIFLPQELLTRERLRQRWQHGSDSFFWRHEEAGALRPVCLGGLLRYRWPDILVFEGGLPAADLATEYLEDLVTDAEVAAACSISVDVVLRAARAGSLPARRIGRAWRFVPAEVTRWQRSRWTRRSHIKR